MERYLFLDFETKDPYIKEGLGSGWPFYSEGRLKVLCFGYAFNDGEVHTSEDVQELHELVRKCTHIVCHNTNYDIGLLHALGVDYRDKVLIDTIILAKLYNNELMDYSLDGLGKKYLGASKAGDVLGEIAKSLGLVRSSAQSATKVAMENLDIVYENNKEEVLRYLIQDVYLTRKLFRFFLNSQVSGQDLGTYSDLIKSTIQSRSRGVRTDRRRAEEVGRYLVPKILSAQEEIFALAGDLNIDSPKQVLEYFLSQGVDVPVPPGRTSPSVGKEFLSACEHPLASHILEYRKYNKVYRDFVKPILEGTRCRVYPEVTIFGARATGRASCANPNLQNIPSRDKELGPLTRSLYLPEEGHMWASLDYSSQESRIQIHLAHLMKNHEVEVFVEEFNKNPSTDLHKLTASFIYGVDQEQVTKEQRAAAKAINLGISYGMGSAKLARELAILQSVSTHGFSGDRRSAKKILSQYHREIPYVQKIIDQCTRLFSVRGYIKTITGRRLVREGAPVYKAFNKAVQGSAADQTNRAIVELYRAGINIMFPIHDSLELSVKDLNTVKEVKEIMETSTPLCIPSIADVKIGKSWGELEKCCLS